MTLSRTAPAAEAAASASVRLRFVGEQPDATNVSSFLFEPESRLAFRAGQYLTLTLPHPDADARGTTRSFSIASSPAEPLVRLSTRLSTPASSFKQALRRLEPGAVLEATGPFGDFVCSTSDSPAVFIAGGIGITPIRSMLLDLAASLRGRCTLLYSNATPDIPFRADFDHLAADWPELKLVYTVTRTALGWRGAIGRMDAEFIARHVERLGESVFFVCGSNSLVDSMRAALASMGVEPGRIRFEAFPGYDR